MADSGCVVCCRDVRIYAVGECDHPVCYECATRMRVLCNQKECPICRRELPKVIYVKKKRTYASVANVKFPLKDGKHRIYFEDSEAEKAHYKLLEHTCKICKDLPPFANFVMLKDHMRKEHERFYCDLCVEHLTIFTHERKCYSRSELALHRRAGDKDNTSHRGHPLCEFCDERFLDSDELYRHLRREHYFCHFCDADGFHHYYNDYEYLREHFRAEHYLCEEDECRTEKFTTAFRTVIDLKAHRAAVHSKNLTRVQSKQTRTLELEFTLKPRAVAASGTGLASTSGTSSDEVDTSGGHHQRERPVAKSRTEALPQQSTSSSVVETTVVQHRPPSVKINPEDFPVLGQKKTHLTLSGSSNVENTLARKLAKLNGRNIVSDKVGEQDFPALGPTKPTKTQSQQPSSSTWRPPMSGGTASLSVTTSSSRSPSTVSGTKNHQLTVKLNQKQDFPSLASNKNGSKSGHQPGTFSVLMSHKQHKVVVPEHQTVIDGGKNRGQSASKTTTSDGWQVLSSAKGGKKDAVESKASSKKEAHLMEEDFPMLEAKGKNLGMMTAAAASSGAWKAKNNTIESVEDVIKREVKNKKKQKGGGESDVEELRKTLPGTLKSTTQTEVNSVENQENVVPKKVSPKQKTERVELKIASVNSTSPNLLSANDFPSLPAAQPKQLIKSPPPGFGATATVPCPTSVRSTAGPPPGFSSPAKTKPPPGFDASAAPNSVTFTNSNGENFTYPMVSLINQEYVMPEEFRERNQKLMEQLMDILGDDNDKFSEFRTQSRSFRKNDTTAAEYYRYCSKLIGKNKFEKIFPELVVLLPDIVKQQQLLAIHKSARGTTSKKPQQFLVCASCQQVLSANDFRTHMNYHSFEANFPALSSRSGSPQRSLLQSVLVSKKQT